MEQDLAVGTVTNGGDGAVTVGTPIGIELRYNCGWSSDTRSILVIWTTYMQIRMF